MDEFSYASHQKAAAAGQAGLSVGDIDYWEINEAFSVVPLYAMKELGIESSKVNVKGGHWPLVTQWGLVAFVWLGLWLIP